MEPGGPHGYDAGKEVHDRTRHSLTDTVRLRVGAMHPVGGQDRDGAPELLKSLCGAIPRLRHVFADCAYGGDKLQGELAKLGKRTIEIVKRSNAAKVLCPLPRIARLSFTVTIAGRMESPKARVGRGAPRFSPPEARLATRKACAEDTLATIAPQAMRARGAFAQREG